MSQKNERLANEIIRTYWGLETRPLVSETVEEVIKKLMSEDPTRKSDDKEQPLDKPLK